MSAGVVEFPSGPERALPSSPEAEHAIIGGILLDNFLIAQVAGVCRPEWFHSQRNRIVYESILRVSLDGSAADYVTIAADLRTRGELDKIGGAATIGEYIDGHPVLGNLDYYCRIVREKAQLRALIHAGTIQVSEAVSGEFDASDALARAMARVRRIADGAGIERDDSIGTAIEQLHESVSDPDKAQGVLTGFPSLDRWTNGIRRQQQWILAAQTSVGKSAFAASIALNAARWGKWVDVLTYEMSAEEYTARLISLGWTIDLTRLERGRLLREELERYKAARVELAKLPMRICEASGMGTREIRARAARFASRGECDLLIVDHMGLVEWENRKSGETENISRIARDLKSIAGETDTAILTLHQINREGAKAKGEPELWWLRYAGERDANVVLFLTREEGSDDAGLWLKKQRNGPTGNCGLRFEREFARYYEQ